MIKPNFQLNPLSLQDYLHYSFDLETYGTGIDAIIAEVSCTAFEIDTGKVVDQISMYLDIDEQSRKGRTVTGDTLMFWLGQTEDARKRMMHSSRRYCADNSLPMPLLMHSAMTKLRNFIRKSSHKWFSENITNRNREPIAWGNGISFDIAKITLLAEQANVTMPWPYWGERDMRTFVDLAPNVRVELGKDFQGTPHYGLDDSAHQARIISGIYNVIKEKSNC